MIILTVVVVLLNLLAITSLGYVVDIHFRDIVSLVKSKVFVELLLGLMYKFKYIHTNILFKIELVKHS